MIEWLKETLMGIGVMAICLILYVLYIGFSQMCDEDSKRGEWCRRLGKIGSGTFLTYIAICSILGLIVSIIVIVLFQ